MGISAAGVAAMTGPALAQGSPDFDGWFAETENYDGVTDETGSSQVEVTVGPADVSGGPFAFGPAALRVDPGTTVTWEWTGEGGAHNVVASDGSFESELTEEAGFTYDHTFEEPGVYRYYCTPHQSAGMVGAVVVGDVTIGTDGGGGGGGGDGGFSLPGNPFEQRFMAIFLSIMGFSVVLALLPEIGPATGRTKRTVSRIGYGIHRESGFRGRPLGSMIVGWATFLLVLTAMAVVAVGLWIVGLGVTGFLVALVVFGVILVIYASSLADVSVRPSPRGAILKRQNNSSSTPGSVSSGGVLHANTWRAVPVIRGWLTITALLAIGATVSVVLWTLGGGAVGLLLGLVILGGIAVAYTIRETG